MCVSYCRPCLSIHRKAYFSLRAILKYIKERSLGDDIMLNLRFQFSFVLVGVALVTAVLHVAQGQSITLTDG